MSKKTYRRPKVVEDQMKFQRGKIDGDVDMCIFYGDSVQRCDRALVMNAFGSGHYSLSTKKTMPSFLEELEARGYDLDTLKFTIKKKSQVSPKTVTEQFNDHFPDDRNMVHEPVPDVHAPELVERDHVRPVNHTDQYVQSSTEEDIACLEHILDRLVNIYAESALCDHIIKLNKIINNMNMKGQ